MAAADQREHTTVAGAEVEESFDPGWQRLQQHCLRRQPVWDLAREVLGYAPRLRPLARHHPTLSRRLSARCHSGWRCLISSVQTDEGGVMKILVAGASGAMGKQLLPRLVAGGHEVVGMTRSAGKAEAGRAPRAAPAVPDAPDPPARAPGRAEAGAPATRHERTRPPAAP